MTMRADPIVPAEEWQEAPEGYGEMVGCPEYGEGWSCTLPAMPQGHPQLLGHDERGNEVWMRYRCVAGHWYHVESPAPDASEVNDAGDPTILAVRARAS